MAGKWDGYFETEQVSSVHGYRPQYLCAEEIMKESGFLDKIPQGKLVIADGGYSVKDKQSRTKLALPQTTDSKELQNFKSRARLRQETVNSRLHNFGCLSTLAFRHGYDYHKDAFEAVCVICQYQMDNGSEPFAV
jgi:hypothetical protein